MLDWLGPIGGIILVDLVLSGDNALVIGAAASKLPRRKRLLAISLGGGGAIVLRILFAVLATFLLQLPLLRALGAVILLIIAIRLIMERGERPEEEEVQAAVPDKEKQSIWGSLVTILVADATMSLDNVLAVGALAGGQWIMLVIGLILSILLLLVGSAIVAEFIQRLPWLMDLASLVLAWTAASMLLDDLSLKPWLEQIPWVHIIVPTLAIASIVITELFLWRKAVLARKNA